MDFSFRVKSMKQKLNFISSEFNKYKYAYCPVNVSRAVGPRNVDRAINNLSNNYFIKDLLFPTMLNFLRLLVFEIISCDP